VVGVNREGVLGVLAMIAITVVWIISPGATILLIGGSIGLLTVAVWVARKLRI
jgi:hypothetical protein